MTDLKNFALIGAAGYVAPRHMKAILETGNRLVAAFDPNDSVGIIDNYFPDAHFFTEFERFDRHLDKRRRRGSKDSVDYTAICSPNYLHDSHIRFGLRSGTHVICEKPLVVNPWNLDALKNIERESGYKVSTILQLRLHPAIISLAESIRATPQVRKRDVDLTYITSRGRWYLQSWKADEKKSGGICANIGIHFFDLLHFLFGDLQENVPHLLEPSRAGGYLEFENARVRWFLSLEQEDLPIAQREARQRTFRSITIDGDELEFSGGFADLHTRSYEEILAGRSFGLEDTRIAIEAVAHIRYSGCEAGRGPQHPSVSARLRDIK